MKKFFAAVGVVAATALTLSGCSAAPTASTTTTGAAGGATSNYKVCMVSDQGGFNDKSFNQTSHKGMLDAKDKFGIQTAEVESKDPKDYTNNVQSMVDQKCNLIITVGYTLGDVTYDAAKKYPNTNFAIVDYAYSDAEKNPPLKNLKSLIFNTAESSFEAGYLAAAMSTTGKVGTYGGVNIPTVNIFMDGYYQGVQHFNKEKGKDVKVLGWNPADPKGGLFVPGDLPFTNVAGGKQVAENLKSQGADIIFPVAGAAGEGALQVADASNGSIMTVWVDTDGYVSQPRYAKNILTSVNKAMDVAVFDTITAAKDGKFDNAAYIGTLMNNGTELAPFHDFDSKIAGDIKSDLDKIKSDIIAGTIKIESANQPK